MLFDDDELVVKKKKKREEEWLVSNGENCLPFRNSGSLRYNWQDPSIGFHNLPGGPRPSVVFDRILCMWDNL